MFLKVKYDNAAATAIKLVKQLKVPITEKTIYENLESHPNYPSLLAISDTLNKYKIDTYPIKDVLIDKLPAVPCPFIVHTKVKGKEFKVIDKIEDGKFYFDTQVLNSDEFERIFDGIILVPDFSTGAGDPHYNKTKRDEFLDIIKNLTIVGGIVLVTFLALLLNTTYFTSFNSYIAFTTLFKLIGLITSILLLVQSINANNPLIQKLCQNDTHLNCNAILSSNAAKFVGNLNWSEVGFFYFSGSFLAVLFASQSLVIMQMLSILSIMALPYTFYSVYYQWLVAKQWCILCCTIQAILWLDFFSLFPYLTHPFLHQSTKELSYLIICFLTPALIWTVIKPVLIKAQKIRPLTNQLHIFKYNDNLFSRLLDDQAKYLLPDEKWSIILGSDNPEKIITIVTNPYCNPCSAAHKTLDEILASDKNSTQLRIVFVFGNAYSEMDKRMVVARHLLRLYQTGNKKQVENALSDWYKQENKNFDAWIKKYPAAATDINQKLEKHLEWLNITGINSTPTILVNGYKLPHPYGIADLLYL